MRLENQDFRIVKPNRGDAEAVIDLVVGLARFEHLRPPDSKAKTRLAKDIFDRRLVNVLVAKRGKQLVGYALYFYTYSSFLAKPTLYLEDIFVSSQIRGVGVGEALFNSCLREARGHNCGRMEWQVLDWNRSAMRFYKKLGAEQAGGLVLYRHDLK